MEEDIKACLAVLERGGTILYPTETVWGIGCDAMNEAAIDRVFQIKNRPPEKSLIVLLAEAKDIFKYVAAPHPDVVDILENFERPTTVIYEGALGFPDNAVAPNGSIAIRITTDPFCKMLIKRMRRPLVSTSANLSGQHTPKIFGEIDAAITTGVDYVVKYRQEDATVNPPSRLVRLLDDGNLDILRA